MKRREFVQNTAKAGLGLAYIPYISPSRKKDVHLTILHTNDMHSRIEPFPMDGSRNEGLGGMARRSSLIQQIRKSKDNVLLVDSGDIFQGTPYFNEFLGELEVRLMSTMGYDAVTVGNHDFDGGLENLRNQMNHANFDVLSCNYDFEGTVYEGGSKPYIIKEYDGIRVGMVGVGIELDGLVPESLYAGTRYLDPVESVNHYAAELKEKHGCHLVVVLSHLGYKYRSDRICDVVLAESSSHIDLILGGHTHTFMDRPDIRKNKKGEDVVVHQSGWAGILLGQIDVIFSPSRKASNLSVRSISVG